MNAANFAAFVYVVALMANHSWAVTIQTVPIGNPGNRADHSNNDPELPSGVGAVAYRFAMGSTEVTNAQYVEFLNAVAATDLHGLYSEMMSSTTWGGIVRSGESGSFSYGVKAAALNGTYPYEHKPVVFVSWYDAIRFANWLHNGQPTGPQNAGTTEDGAYTFSGAATLGPRNPGAHWWLPSEDEWYKAAYYDAMNDRYHIYPMGSGDPEGNKPALDTGNSANFFENGYATGNPSFPYTDAGAYALSASPYGTFDQGGNVFEWNERLFLGSERVFRGGSYGSEFEDLYKVFWLSGNPASQGAIVGFRVATIPEPTLLCLLGAFAIVRLLRRKRPHLRPW
jgi:formylglycine-generating enzyme required for sulfatase activity